MTVPLPDIASQAESTASLPPVGRVLRSLERGPDRDRNQSAGVEQELIALVRAGDAAAFERIFDAYAASLLAFAGARLRSREAAEEIVQELFTTIWMRRSGWVVRRSLKTYLFQAVRNRVLNYQRDTRTRERLWFGSADVAMVARVAATDHADDRLGEGELRQAVTTAIAALPERNREVFLLVRQHRLSYAEAADVLAISPKAVEQHMVRAFHALRRRLADWRA